MACCGKGKTKVKNTNLVCAQLIEVEEGNYQRIIGAVTGIDYGWRRDGSIVCLDTKDVTEDWSVVPDCTKC
jgi:hypothetical protein